MIRSRRVQLYLGSKFPFFFLVSFYMFLSCPLSALQYVLIKKKKKSYDSYPYVAVLMLSDTTHMTGGETYIKKGDGSAAKVYGHQPIFANSFITNNPEHRLKDPPWDTA